MIYFLRHQETLNNRLGVISGQKDSPIIVSNISIEMINRVDVIYSSPSKRCLDTLQQVSGLEVSPVIDARLVERNMGIFENYSRKDLCEEYGDFFLEANGKIRYRFELTPPKGESLSDFYNRLYSFCNENLFNHKEQNILICSHNQSMKMLYLILEDIQPNEEIWGKMSFPNGKIVSAPIY